MANAIWRITASNQNLGNSPLGALPQNRVIDIPANRVIIRWGNKVPYTGGQLRTTISNFNAVNVRVYIRNSTIAQKSAGSQSNVDFVLFTQGQNYAIERMELIDNMGLGRSLYIGTR